MKTFQHFLYFFPLSYCIGNLLMFHLFFVIIITITHLLPVLPIVWKMQRNSLDPQGVLFLCKKRKQTTIVTRLEPSSYPQLTSRLIEMKLSLFKDLLIYCFSLQTSQSFVCITPLMICNNKTIQQGVNNGISDDVSLK